jgi:uncharacterized protein YjiS (DUF1127 family)
MTTTMTTINATACRQHDRDHATIGTALRANWTRYKRARARRRTERILSGLSERTLKDIGFTAHEIGSVVHGTPGSRLQRHDDCWDERTKR